MSLKVAIIEDEPANARNLEYTLEEIDPAIEVLVKLENIADSVNWLGEHMEDCDLLFMDIRLTDGLSFEIFQQLEPKVPVIFITAYNDYALEAFKANGIDYILKPFHAEEVERALDKFRLLKGEEEAADYPGVDYSELLDYIQKQGQTGYRQSFLVHYQDKLIPLPVERIQWMYLEQEIIYAYTDDKRRYTIDSTLEKIQSEIPPREYFRVNRQFIIRRSAVQEIDFYFNGRLIVHVLPESPEKIIVSKAKATEFKKWLDA